MTAHHQVFRMWFQHNQAIDNDSISRFDSSDNEQDTADEISQQADKPRCQVQHLEPSADVFRDCKQLTSEQEAPNTGCTDRGIFHCITSRITTTTRMRGTAQPDGRPAVELIETLVPVLLFSSCGLKCTYVQSSSITVHSKLKSATWS